MHILAAVRNLHTSKSPSYPNGVIHRDIKPDNFVVDGDARVKIIDFGISCGIDEQESENADKKILYTLGTIAYLPEEAFKHRIYNQKTDLYGTGLVIALGLRGHGYDNYR